MLITHLLKAPWRLEATQNITHLPVWRTLMRGSDTLRIPELRHTRHRVEQGQDIELRGDEQEMVHADTSSGSVGGAGGAAMVAGGGSVMGSGGAKPRLRAATCASDGKLLVMAGSSVVVSA